MLLTHCKSPQSAQRETPFITPKGCGLNWVGNVILHSGFVKELFIIKTGNAEGYFRKRE